MKTFTILIIITFTIFLKSIMTFINMNFKVQALKNKCTVLKTLEFIANNGICQLKKITAYLNIYPYRCTYKFN